MLGGSVETPIAYHADRSGRHEEVDRGAPGHTFAQCGGRDVEARHRDFDTPPIPDRIRQIGTVAGSRHDRDRAQGAEIVDAVPGVEARGRIGADDQEQLTTGRRQLLDGVDRVRRALAFDLDRAHLEPVDAFDRGAHHLQPRDRGRHHRAALLPRVPRDGQDRPIECELLTRFERGHEMADMHRIEGASEDPEALGRHIHRGQSMNLLFDGSVNGT